MDADRELRANPRLKKKVRRPGAPRLPAGRSALTLHSQATDGRGDSPPPADILEMMDDVGTSMMDGGSY